MNLNIDPIPDIADIQHKFKALEHSRLVELDNALIADLSTKLVAMVKDQLRPIENSVSCYINGDEDRDVTNVLQAFRSRGYRVEVFEAPGYSSGSTIRSIRVLF